MADAPSLFFQEPQVILDRMVSRYSELVGRPVLKQQAEYLIYSSLAEEIVMFRAAQDAALAQMFVRFSTAPIVDYLAENVGISRLPDSPAIATLIFNLLPGHGQVTIPALTKVGTTDGLMVFQTDSEAVVAVGVNSVEIEATAMLDGPQGNSYAPGLVSNLIDALPFVTTVSNKYVTSGGADVETTEGLRERIMLAPNKNNAAGSAQSYKYWAMTANSSIIDVEVVAPKDGAGNSIGGQVIVYPLIAGGIATPQAILDAVDATLDSDSKRPLTDNVSVQSPTVVNYTIPLEIVLKNGVIQSANETLVTNAISAYAIKQARSLGADITESQIVAAAMNPDIHSIKLPGFTDIIVSKTEVAVCTNIIISSTTYEDVDA